MFKKALSIILAISMIMSLCCTVSLAADGVVINVGGATNEVRGNAGETITVPVYISGIDDGIIGYDTLISYDADYLTPVVERGSCINYVTVEVPGYGSMTVLDSELRLGTIIGEIRETGSISVGGIEGNSVYADDSTKDTKFFAIKFKINESVTRRVTTEIGMTVDKVSYLADSEGTVADYENITVNAADIIINPDVVTPVDITISDLSKTYNGTAQGATIALGENVSHTVTYDGKADLPVNAGSYTVEVNVTEDGFGGTRTDTLVINPAPVSVTAKNAEKYVGQTDPATFEYTYEGTLYGSDAFTGSLAREAGEEADTYAINRGSLSLGSNYQINFTAGTFTIKPKLDQDVSMTTPIQTGKIYGDGGFKWTFELDEESGCTETSYTSSNGNAATIDAEGNVAIVGVGTTKLAFTVKGNEIYNDYKYEGDFVVNKRPLAIEIEDKVEIVDGIVPTLTYKPLAADALAAGDTIEVVLERAAGEALDTPYTISAKSVVIKNPSDSDVTGFYDIDVTEGTYTIISKFLQDVEVGTIASSKVYGDADFEFEIVDNETNVTGDITVTSSNTDAATVAYENGVVTVDVKNAGSTEIRVYRAGNNEYADLDVKTTLVVAPRELSIEANDLSVKIGKALPSLDGQWALVSGELVAGDAITGELAYETGASTAEVGATFDIEKGTLTAGANYNINFTNGTLTIINKTSQTITVADIAAKTYGDSGFMLEVTEDATSGLSAYTYSISGSETEQTDTSVATIDAAGNVAITGAGTAYITVTEPGDDEYAATSVTKALVVNKAPLTATVTVVDKVYGQDLEAPVVSYAGFVNSEDESALATLPTVAGMPVGKAAAGEYQITASGAEAANYEITYVADTLTVSRRAIEIDSFDVFDKVADGTTTATLNTSALVFKTGETTGFVADDEIIAQVTATCEFEDADPGDNKTVTMSNVSAVLTGRDAENYVFVAPDPDLTTTATIAERMTAQDIADQIETSITVSANEEVLTLPTVPEGYTISIKTSDNEDVLALDGTINAIDTDTVVNVTFEVVSDVDETDVGITSLVAVAIPKAAKKTVSVSVSGVGEIQGNYGEQTVGTLIELVAVPGTRYKVGEWIVDGVSIGKIGSTYSFILENDISIGVIFESAGGTYRPSGGSSGSSVSYTVTFNSNEGSKVESQKVVSGNVATEPAAPTKDGYIFAGWYKESSFANKFDFESKIVSNITLYAKWDVDNTKNQIILTIGETKALVFGEEKENDVAPIIVNDRTMLPARFVAESLGATVEWDEATSKVTITKGEIVIEIIIGAETALVNGEEVVLDSPAFLQDSRTYTPIRFISEALGATVEWIEETETVIITPGATENAEA